METDRPGANIDNIILIRLYHKTYYYLFEPSEDLKIKFRRKISKCTNRSELNEFVHSTFMCAISEIIDCWNIEQHLWPTYLDGIHYSTRVHIPKYIQLMKI